VSALSESHLAMLRASAIGDEVIGGRGYETVAVGSHLKKLGFGDTQSRVPALLLPIHGVQGGIVNYQIRPDQPRIVKGKAVKYETPRGSMMVMDVHPSVRHLLRDPAGPLFVTEGIKKGDALASKGVCTVALLGVWNFRGTNDLGGKTALADWEYIALNGRRVYIVFDSDVMLKPEVHAALVRLKSFLEGRRAEIAIVYLPAGPHGEKVGVDDFLVSGKTLDDVMQLATFDIREPSADASMDDDDGQAAQADVLVAIGRRCELFHDETDAGFARIVFEDHAEIWPLHSKRFENWLRRQHYLDRGKAPGSDALRAALGVLDGIAFYDGPDHQLANRITGQDGAVYYDLADASWNAVRIGPDGWSLCPQAPILFRRYAHQRPQVQPARDGDIHAVLPFLNVRVEDQLLLLTWLVAAFVPDIPHPIPEFHGEKGAGKSVGQRVLSRLIDPSAVESLTFPSDVRELVQQLSHHYAPVYDNVDSLSPWLSDVLCRAVTGEGFSKRELYSDDDDVIYSYRRVVMLNGINVVARRPDLLDRTILIGLERISRDARLEEAEFWSAFEAQRPRILGGIFDTLSAALRLYPTVRPRALERMADYTRFGAAIAIALGHSPEEFLAAYSGNVSAQTAEAVQGHVVGSAVLQLMSNRDEWVGTPAELLGALETAGEAARLFRRSANGKVDAKGWPGAPHILTRRLNEVRSNLADLGIYVQRARGDERTIVITRGPIASETSDGSDGSVGSEADAVLHPVATDATVATLPEPGQPIHAQKREMLTL
jgi:Domain of unknown function (DUF3854)